MKPTEDRTAELGKVRRALRMVSMSLPHLAGLAAAARLSIDPRVATMAVFASGRILVNPDFLATLAPRETMFVLAHELMHLALRTHDRQHGSDPLLVNMAHDYIINDMLSMDLQQDIPAGGLCRPDARHRSMESIVAELQDYLPSTAQHAGGWLQPGPKATKRKPPSSGLGEQLRQALTAAGLPIPPEAEDADEPPEPPPPIELPGDVFSDDLERQWFPGADAGQIAEQTRTICELAARADSVATVIERMKQVPSVPRYVDYFPRSDAYVAALRGIYAPVWQSALQRWLDAVAPGPRSFARPSRRGADRSDVVLPGRSREGWILHIVLDTSGSMTDTIPRALGAIADFCVNAGVEQVHLLQCDTSVTQDEFVPIESLDYYQISGYGGSDMSPAMQRLAEDSEVEAVLVLTDGDISYPMEPPPYSVLWVVSTADANWFQPPYGSVLSMPP